MITNIIEFLSFSFILKGILAGLIIGIIAPYIGSFIVPKRYALISDTLSHVALLGVSMGVLLGIMPTISAIVVTVVLSILIEKLRSSEKIQGDTLLAVFLNASLSLALIFISISKNTSINIQSYLFGSITTVTNLELTTIFIVGSIVFFILLILTKELIFITYDEENAIAQGIPVNIINSVLIASTATIIALSIQIIGALLIGALIVLPTIASSLISRNTLEFRIYAILFGLVAVVSGILISYSFNLPTGSVIALICTMELILTSLFKKIIK